MRAISFVSTLLALASSSSGQEADWLWQFTDDEEDSPEVRKQISRGSKEIARLLLGKEEGEGEGESEENVTPTPTLEPPTPVSEAAIDVLGQSGKFSIFDKAVGKADVNAVTVEVDALRELDAEGDAVGTSGSVKHSLETFASQDFTIHPAESATIGSVLATMVSFDTPISSIGKLSVDTFILKNGGTIGTDTESWEVRANDVKFNILLSDWKFCGDGSECKKGKKNQIGEFIDVLVKIKGKAATPETKADGNSSKSFELGGDVDLELSDRVLVDGKWIAMPAGFPKMEVKGSAAIFTFRFPKFAHNATYDPIVGFSDSLPTTTTTTTASATPEPPQLPTSAPPTPELTELPTPAPPTLEPPTPAPPTPEPPQLPTSAPPTPELTELPTPAPPTPEPPTPAPPTPEPPQLPTSTPPTPELTELPTPAPSTPEPPTPAPPTPEPPQLWTSAPPTPEPPTQETVVSTTLEVKLTTKAADFKAEEFEKAVSNASGIQGAIDVHVDYTFTFALTASYSVPKSITEPECVTLMARIYNISKAMITCEARAILADGGNVSIRRLATKTTDVYELDVTVTSEQQKLIAAVEGKAENTEAVVGTIANELEVPLQSVVQTQTPQSSIDISLTIVKKASLKTLRLEPDMLAEELSKELGTETQVEVTKQTHVVTLTPTPSPSEEPPSRPTASPTSTPAPTNVPFQATPDLPAPPTPPTSTLATPVPPTSGPDTPSPPQATPSPTTLRTPTPYLGTPLPPPSPTADAPTPAPTLVLQVATEDDEKLLDAAQSVSLTWAAVAAIAVAGLA